MVYERNIELKEKQEKLIAEIRKIIGSKRFTFSSDYFEQCKYNTPCIGEGERPYYALTRGYVYCPCRVVFSTNDENTEYGAHILKYSLSGYQVTAKRIHLEDLFVKDLEKIYNDLKFYLWWEKEVRHKLLKAKLVECENYVKMFEKMSDRN